jgi:hypothetical protein
MKKLALILSFGVFATACATSSYTTGAGAKHKEAQAERVIERINLKR